MKPTLPGLAIACVLLCSCASSSTSQSSGDAAPAAPAAGNPYPNMSEREQERTGMLQKIQALGREIAELKSRNQAATPIPLPAEPEATNAAAQKSPRMLKIVFHPRNASARPQAPQLVTPGPANRETIVIQDTGMIFRVMHGFARTEFHPSKALQLKLLEAARAGKQIEIRGRTDAAAADAANREVAMQRALSARVFLANNGIHPSKIHVDYRAAGDNVADNSTAEGRARNRRVEIETIGIAPAVLEDMAAVIRQDLQ